MFNKSIKSVWLVIFLSSVLSLSPSAQALPKVFRLSTSTNAPYNTEDRQGFLDKIVEEVFQRIGLKGEISYYNASARALINANQNIDQGVAMRIRGLEKKYPNLVRVDEPLISNDFVAYSKNLHANIDGWKSLKPYIVAYIHGWLIFENNLLPGQKKNSLTKPEQMFAMLQKGRVDLVLYERWQGLQEAQDSGVEVKVHEPPLASVNMFMYIHRDYADLAPKMAQVLRDMKADGSYQKIYNQTLEVLLP
jgi:polar amino acid transport system substrate-binding protein